MGGCIKGRVERLTKRYVQLCKVLIRARRPATALGIKTGIHYDTVWRSGYLLDNPFAKFYSRGKSFLSAVFAECFQYLVIINCIRIILYYTRRPRPLVGRYKITRCSVGSLCISSFRVPTYSTTRAYGLDAHTSACSTPISHVAR